MVLNELGSKLANALSSLSKHTIIDEEIMEDVLKEITKALLSADVNVQYVVQMKKNIVKAVDINDLAGGINAKKVLEKAVFNELCNMLDGGDAKSEVRAKFVPKKGKPKALSCLWVYKVAVKQRLAQNTRVITLGKGLSQR